MTRRQLYTMQLHLPNTLRDLSSGIRLFILKHQLFLLGILWGMLNELLDVWEVDFMYGRILLSLRVESSVSIDRLIIEGASGERANIYTQSVQDFLRT